LALHAGSGGTSTTTYVLYVLGGVLGIAVLASTVSCFSKRKDTLLKPQVQLSPVVFAAPQQPPSPVVQQQPQLLCAMYPEQRVQHGVPPQYAAAAPSFPLRASAGASCHQQQQQQQAAAAPQQAMVIADGPVHCISQQQAAPAPQQAVVIAGGPVHRISVALPSSQ
jgi:hypothetical protein